MYTTLSHTYVGLRGVVPSDIRGHIFDAALRTVIIHIHVSTQLATHNVKTNYIV